MKCPGQDMKYWKENAIFEVACPKCQTLVEFYKDDTSRKCGGCGHRFVNPKMDFGCASYCQYAEQCIGTLPEEFTGSRDVLLKDKVAVEMKRHFQTDFKSIRQASSTAQFAERIGKAEGGAELASLLCAAYLCGTELAAARAILEKVGANDQLIEQITVLLGDQREGRECRSLPAKILHDALLLRLVQEQLREQPADGERLQQQAAELVTASARDMATELFGKGAGSRA